MAIKHDPIEHNLSTSSTDTEFCYSSDSVQTSENESVTNPQQITNVSNFNIKCKRSMRDNSTQVRIAKRNCSIQHFPHMHSKSAQTVTDKIKTSSRATQYSSPPHKSSHANKLLNMLNEGDAFSKFADIIHDSQQTSKFVKCVQSIASGHLETTNLAWKSFLDIGTLFSLKSTTQMEYDPEWLEFCQVIYHMFGVGVVNALRGRGHFSQVTSQKTFKSKYPPSLGEFNFPIPSVPMLKKLNIGFPSEIPVGFVKQSLDLAEE